MTPMANTLALSRPPGTGERRVPSENGALNVASRKTVARLLHSGAGHERTLWKTTEVGAGPDKWFLTPRDERPGVRPL